MGFYPPATLVRDAQRRSVEVRPPDVHRSRAECVVEDGAVRIGLGEIAELGEEKAKALLAERDRGGPFANLGELVQRSGLREPPLEALIMSGACDTFGGSRRELLWELGLVPRAESVPGSGGEEKQLALPLDPTVETPELREQTPWERMLAEYRTTRISVDVHPMTLLRPHLSPRVLSSRQLGEAAHGRRVTTAGMTVARQRPSTANGVVFMLIEDEYGTFNLVVPPPVYDRFRPVVRGEPLVLVHGRLERVGRNQNVVVERLETLGPLARRVSEHPDVGASLPDAHHFGHR
jgi:error-prone DNA polymerase